MTSTKKKLGKITHNLSTPATRFYAFVAFFVLVFFMGGGARDDIQSLLVLRPLAVIFCAYALTVKTPEQWKGRTFPLYIAGALLALMVIQLIPLPPSVWAALPERQIFAEIANLAGIEQPWRPLTLSPSKTLNSLFSLTVPIAAMMLYLNLDREYRRRAVPVIIILCVVSALWGIFQIVGPPRGPFYFYRISNTGMAIGLFANRNHQAIMLACAIAMLGWYAASRMQGGKSVDRKYYASIIAILIFVPLIFIIGSRAGLLLMFPAMAMALFFIGFEHFRPASKKRAGRGKKQKSVTFSTRNVLFIASVIAIIGIVASSVLLSRSLALDRLLGADRLLELRFQTLPTLIHMVEIYFPWGGGFGSFEHLYKIYEPQNLLSTRYLNQAHNDWLQFLIEGGLPAIGIAAAAFVWIVTRVAVLFKNRLASASAAKQGLMCLTVMGLLLLASLGDYPLRVPSIAATFAVLACILNDNVRSLQRHRRE